MRARPHPTGSAIEAAAEPPKPSDAARLTRAWAVGATLALIALGLAWELWLAPTGARTLALKVVPLALALSGLLRYRLRTYRWMSLLVWLYVAEGALRFASDRGLGSVLGGVELVLALGLFGACAMHVRHRLKGPKMEVAP